VQLAEAPGRWTDQAWWHARIDEALDDRDPVLSNLRITLVHWELSIALRRLIGADSGANFHTWAVWGSKTAGRTIRRQDLPIPMRAVTPAGVLAGAGAAELICRSRRFERGRGARGRAAAVTGGACLGAAASRAGGGGAPPAAPKKIRGH
jgi:hypothetical protein